MKKLNKLKSTLLFELDTPVFYILNTLVSALVRLETNSSLYLELLNFSLQTGSKINETVRRHTYFN